MFTRFRPMTATAMAAILGCSMMAMTAPAAAKEKPAKEEPAKGPKLSPSKAFAPIGKQMEDASKKKDAAALQAAVTAGQAVATSNDDKYFLGFYTLQLGILAKNEALQEQVIAGKTAKEIRESWQPALKAFKEIRKKYLIYEDF